MKRKLTAICGPLVVGLIGTAYATCYYEATLLCASQYDWVGTQYETSCSGQTPVRARFDWYNRDKTTSQVPGQTGRTSFLTGDCSGDSDYLNCDLQDWRANGVFTSNDGAHKEHWPDPSANSCT